jgi:hypothetical protein
VKSLDEILWPRGHRDIADAEAYAREWWRQFHADGLQKQADGEFEPSRLDLKRAAAADAKRPRRRR